LGGGLTICDFDIAVVIWAESGAGKKGLWGRRNGKEGVNCQDAKEGGGGGGGGLNSEGVGNVRFIPMHG